jgi:hypothetical protein
MAGDGLVPGPVLATLRNTNRWQCWSTLFIWMQMIRRRIWYLLLRTSPKT